MPRLDFSEACVDFRERFVPRDLAPRVTVADHRVAHTVGIAVEILDR